MVNLTPGCNPDVLALARHEFLVCHAMLTDEGIPWRLEDGSELSLSQRLEMYVNRVNFDFENLGC